MLEISIIGQNTRWHFLTFSPNSWEFLVQILHAYYAILSTLYDKFIFNYLQLCWFQTSLSETMVRWRSSMFGGDGASARIALGSPRSSTLACRTTCSRELLCTAHNPVELNVDLYSTYYFRKPLTIAEKGWGQDRLTESSGSLDDVWKRRVFGIPKC